VSWPKRPRREATSRKSCGAGRRPSHARRISSRCCASAGVVDAGGAGLLELVRGLASAVSGEPLPDAPELQKELTVEAIHQELSRYRYCTTFLIEGDDLDADAIEGELEQLGDSTRSSSADSDALKVHVHTDEPGRGARCRRRQGGDRPRRDREHARADVQREERLCRRCPMPGRSERRRSPSSRATATGAVREPGAVEIVEGGQTMNPSTADLVAAVAPNRRRRGDRAAEQLQRDPLGRAGGRARGEAGHGGANGLDPRRIGGDGLVPAGTLAADNAAEMESVLESLVTGEVTLASRDAELNGVSVHRGGWLGLAAGRGGRSG
jgi:hypothetical protein